MAAAVIAWLRSLLFVAVVVTATAVLAIGGLPLLVLDRARAARLTRLCSRVQIGLLRTICGLEVTLRGLERLPEGPVLIAAKHQSALETYLLAARLPRATFVLKREILMVPIAGWYVATLDIIAVDRAGGAGALRAMLRRARRAAAEGRRIVIFPEGTRTKPDEAAPYQPGIAALYGELDLPVVPVALDTGRFWPRRSLVKRPGRATVEFLEPIPPGLGREAFMTLLRERIEAGCAALDASGKAAEATAGRPRPT